MVHRFAIDIKGVSSRLFLIVFASCCCGSGLIVNITAQKLEEVDVLQVLMMLLFAIMTLAPACAQAEKPKTAEKPKAIEPLISKDTRLMVFSPHPDDESLGAAGLIQRVLKTGGSVKVVFMTNGDGFPEAVEMGGTSPIRLQRTSATMVKTAWVNL